MMQNSRKPYRGKRRSGAAFLLIVLTLSCLLFGISLLSPSDKVAQQTADTELQPSTVAAGELSPSVTAPPPSPAPAVGTLLSSGSGLNENYYKSFDFSGRPADLTGSGFVLGKEQAATNTCTGQDHPGPLSIHYDSDTVIKTAKLYYPEDRFEIFMGSASDLKIASGCMFEVLLEDASASLLYAREIVVSEFVF